MRTSILLARLMGPPFVAAGLGLLLNGGAYRLVLTQALADYALIYVSGLLSLVAGLAVIQAHNVWARDWTVVITVLGWLLAIGGAVRIIVPQIPQAVGSAYLAHGAVLVVIAIICLAVGGLLSVKGYWQ